LSQSRSRNYEALAENITTVVELPGVAATLDTEEEEARPVLFFLSGVSVVY